MPILHWLNDEEARKTSSRVPYRLLEADDAHSYGDPIVENILIQGDNLEALKALLPYDDNLEHSIWLSTMYPRLEILRDLLSDDGSIWVSMDDNEEPYIKILLDEIFHRNNFVATVVWQKRTSPDARIQIGAAHDYIIVYAKNANHVAFNKMLLTEEQKKNFKNPDNDPRGPWVSTDFSAQGWRPNQMYKLKTPSGAEYEPPPGRCWVNLEIEYYRLVAEGRMWFGKDGNGRPRTKTYLYENEGVSSWTWWTNVEVGHNQEAKKEINLLFGGGNAFDTPKPERLLHRILHISTNPNDLVLDSFLGSGTTAAVAHKMGRQYIGIEMGEHAITHCTPRLKKVVDGEQGGISNEVNWQGGGGFHFYKLGEAIFDEEGKINPAVKFRALAAHVWFTETHTPLGAKSKKASPLLGVHNGIAYYLLYNGILGDQSKDGGNVLTGKILASLPPHHGQKVIYGELTTFSSQRLARENILFKQVPYDIKAR
jgi:adenine-specific DNA-methyltransferase